MKLTWEKISDYCLQSGDYTIAKVWLRAAWRYALYRLSVFVGVFDSAELAKGAANA